MPRTNLPTDLLRTLTTVIDLGGYTRAAEALGRTQPAVSLQIGRLEALLDCKLIEQSGRSMKLTEPGEALAQFARQILQINDEAVAHFSSPSASGGLRIGLPNDYAVSFLQEALAGFVLEHPSVTLEVHCNLSRNLVDALNRDELDIVVGLSASGDNPFLVRIWEDTPLWAAGKHYVINENTEIPLLVHPEGCEYRNRMIAALAQNQRRWRIAFTSLGIAELQQAVHSGLGVTALTRKTLQKEMVVLTEDQGFPQLSNIRVGLFYKQAKLTDAGVMLVNLLTQRLDEASNN
jgi:DNA-binding transcriptional LysR family regulator